MAKQVTVKHLLYIVVMSVCNKVGKNAWDSCIPTELLLPVFVTAVIVKRYIPDKGAPGEGGIL